MLCICCLCDTFHITRSLCMLDVGLQSSTPVARVNIAMREYTILFVLKFESLVIVLQHEVPALWTSCLSDWASVLFAICTIWNNCKAYGKKFLPITCWKTRICNTTRPLGNTRLRLHKCFAIAMYWKQYIIFVCLTMNLPVYCLGLSNNTNIFMVRSDDKIPTSLKVNTFKKHF